METPNLMDEESQKEVENNILKTGVILISGCAVIAMALSITAFFWILKYVGE